MNLKHTIVLLILCIVLLPIPNIMAAEKERPDIRAMYSFVKKREMPTTCIKPLRDWVAEYVGKNEIKDNQFKFSDLFNFSNQLESATIKLTPYVAKTNMLYTTDQKGNIPSQTGSTCYTSSAESGQIKSPDVIWADKKTKETNDKLYFGGNLLAAYLTRDSIALTDGKYNTQPLDVEPNTEEQFACGTQPTGEQQVNFMDKNEGLNIFASIASWIQDAYLNALCADPACNCVETTMWIQNDSTVNHITSSMFRLSSGTEEMAKIPGEKLQPNEKAQNSGGVVNAIAKPYVVGKLWDLVQNIAGCIQEQATKNNVNEPVGPACYNATKMLELDDQFLNCKFAPYAKRAEMPECNRNWLSNIVGSVKNSLQGTGSQNVQEPNESNRTVPIP